MVKILLSSLYESRPATFHGTRCNDVFQPREAAKEAGVDKTTVWRAIKAGRLSATRTDTGGFAIEPAELFHAFPPQHRSEHSTGQDATLLTLETERPAIPDNLAVKWAVAEAELAALKVLLFEVKTNRDELREDRNGWRARAERLLTDQRRPWWRRLAS